ncbi:cation-translocating P-type ATPase [Turneriella parva]|uniref:ATPase, P-type (Transporting), HAD superfamily, subfamily IC n=1 Tax=Turneriella parva (strain ATCC BAA-1111 / DSM 21527 / NCTC 11395 / H) TaxID=869212 RepID=I4B281_TURPD|nr:cation-transporting P-type ATPase [Turneriella parva]AFM11388.1 ATPase, P-type (transporting), HAD superfamily, subfamily IC [Turneriella parva DSM 21527]
MANGFHTGLAEKWLESFGTDKTRGLTAGEAHRRLTTHGENRITAKTKRSKLDLLAEQFKNLLVLLLVAASVLSFLLGSVNDGAVLMAIVVINALVGFFQDWKSENIAARLGSLVTESAIAVRDGQRIEVPVVSLVPGDVIYLQEGEGVPADCRLISATTVMANEMALTGESVSSEKSHTFSSDDDALPLPDRRNMLYFGTALVRGECTALVCATGDKTELGKIAVSSENMTRELSPLQKELNTLGGKITRFALTLAVLLFAVQLLRDEPLKTALIFAVSIAAAMVPEGLPAQISMGLSLGVARLARKNGVVKRLSSVEALGAATVIASDKTGTITRNEMTITAAYFEDKNYRITGTGYNPGGEIFDESGKVMNVDSLGEAKILFLAGFLSSTGTVNPPDEFHSEYYALGDPTEAAFATLLMKAGFVSSEISAAYPRLQLFPFDSVRKRVSIVREHNGKNIVFVKGSIESLLPLCTYRRVAGADTPMTDALREELLAVSRAYSAQALRVIALAYRDLAPGEKVTEESAESNLIFSGFVTMIDPPRDEVKDAVKAAREAGLRLMMITGDHHATARSIANAIGMAGHDKTPLPVVNSDELHAMNAQELGSTLSAPAVVFSRVSPDEKLRIIEALQARGDVVAVTGDGVNDTLSLKRADIGVAMGHGGSKVAQEAASLILLDNSFATIVAAVREGRTIFRNLQNNVVATLSSNFTELLCVLAGFALLPFGLPPIILPVQILLVDLVGEMLPLLMLTYDPASPGIMREAPRKKGALLDKRKLVHVGATGLVRGVLSTLVFIAVFRRHTGEAAAWETGLAATFATIVTTQFVGIFFLRARGALPGREFFSNPYLFLGIALSLGAMLALIYVPFFNTYLHTNPLTRADWQIIGLGLAVFCAFSVLYGLIRSFLAKKTPNQK